MAASQKSTAPLTDNASVHGRELMAAQKKEWQVQMPAFPVSLMISTST